MGILKSIRALSVTDPRAWDRSLWNLRGSQSLSGEVVTEDTALTYSAVYNAVTLIAGTIGALPCHLMQKKSELKGGKKVETKRIADDRKMYRVLHDEWNPYMTAMAGRECLMAHVLLWGNGYAEINRNGYGEVVELWPITPDRVDPEMRGGKLVYKIRVDNQDKYLPREKVLHIPGLGFDGFTGYSVIAMARKSIGLSMALETFGALYFGQGTHPGVVVSHPGVLKDPTKLRDSLTGAYSGLGKTHRLMLLEENMKIEKIGIPPEDSQFLESRTFQIDEVARWFNLPVHKLKEMTKSSFSNIESEQRSFYGDSILPWLVRLEQNYNMQLLSLSDKEYSGRGRLYYKHNAEGILRADTVARGEFYTKMFNVGAMSVNDIRAKEDMDPVDGGDIYLVPLNMTSLENAGKPPEPPKPPALPPASVPEPDKRRPAK
jgi:HK97 family phage portal protein